MDDLSQTLNMCYGKVNLSVRRATFAALRVSAPFVRDSAIDTAKRRPGTKIVTNVSNHPAVNGVLVNEDCAVKEGTIVMLTSSWQRGGAGLRSGAILLRIRNTAALLNIIAKLPIGPDNLLGDTHSVFRGCADILSPQEAVVFGIQVPSRYVQQYFDVDEVEECFDIRELRPETAKRPEAQLVSTGSGLVMREVPATPTRRMRFRSNV